MNFFIKAGNLIKLITQSRISNVSVGTEDNDVVIKKQLENIVPTPRRAGVYFANSANGVTHVIPHGMPSNVLCVNITLGNSITANQNYVVTFDDVNITFVHQDAGAFVSTDIYWVAFG